ncbi:uncharacterized protein LOC144042662 [Vanacampus margaritifer]
MDRGLILVVAMLAVLAALPAVRGTQHLTFDNTVMANVTREGCGVTNLCLELPNDCDPANNNTGCLFVSLNADAPMSSDSFNLTVRLSGNSSDLIAFGLTQNFVTDTTQLFVCGTNGTEFFFETLLRSSNGSLMPNERNTSQIRNRLNGTLIQCEFIIPNLNTRMMGEMLDGTTAVVIVGNGTVNATTGRTQNFMSLLFTAQPVNLTNANGNVIEPTLTLNINRDGCGNNKLCVETPADCNPQNDPACLFTSLDTIDATMETFNILVELAGQSAGYVAMGLTPTLSEGVTNLYICGRNSSDDNSFVFLTVDQNNTNNAFTLVDRQVADLRYAVNGTSIQCTFTIVGINSTSMSRQDITGTSNSVVLGTGASIQDNEISEFDLRESTPVLDISDAGANIVIPVVLSPLNITREGCGTTNLCLETPVACDPVMDLMCQFVSSNFSVSSNNAFNLTVRLSGYSMGYFALGLSQSQNLTEGTSTVFACGNDTETGQLFLRIFTRNNMDGTFTSVNRDVDNAIIEVENRSIDCQFTIPNLNSAELRETNGTIAQVFLANGTLTQSGLNPLIVLVEDRLNLTSATGQITESAVDNGARAERSSGAMLILLSLVTLLAAFRG